MNSISAQVYDRMVGHLKNGTTDCAETALDVPISNFTNPEHLARELTVFRNRPLVAALASELPEAGSFVTRDILGSALLIVRKKSGEVAAYLNMCRHRGGKVELQEKGRKPFFVCSYHGWSYDGEGSLRGVPFEDHLGEIDRGCRSLHSVECEERHGFIWVNLSNSGQSVAEFLGPADERLAEFDIANTTIFMTKTIETEINWKIVMDGAIDVLHPQFLHPTGVGKLIDTNVSVWSDYGRCGQSLSARKRLGEKVKAGENIEAGWRYISGNFMIFPNANLIFAPDHFEFWTLWPDLKDPSRATIQIRFLIDPAKLNDDMAARLNKSWEILEEAATTEDFPMEVTIQQNAMSHSEGTFFYGKSEVACQHLHRQMAKEMETLAA